MTPGTYNIQDTVKGDTLDEIIFTMTDEDGDPINLTGYAIKAMFKKYPLLVAVKTISIGSGITIVSAANGQFKIDAFTVTMGAGVYDYDIQFTVGQIVKTYISGKFEVLKEVTT